MATKKSSKSEKNSPSLGLSGLKPARGSRKVRKRLGIGEGSGNGKTCGKGQKGQTSRSGFGLPAGFEGGQMPLYRRLPKVGFTSRKKIRGENVYTPVSVERLAKMAEGGEITLQRLKDAGIVPTSRKTRIKILAGGELKTKVVVEAHAVSAAAKIAIEAAGGSIRILS